MTNTCERLINADETLIPLLDVPDNVPRSRKGRKVHAVTVHRWIYVGLAGGIKLETLRFGRRVYTSREALKRFFDRVTFAMDGKHHGTDPTPSEAGVQANAELVAAGC